MKQNKPISILVFCIIILAVTSAIAGIFSDSGSGPYEYQSIRGKTVQIYGKGLYYHMSADVAIQGIAQDYVTLFLGIPLLLAALFWARKGSLRGRFVLAGVLNYFLVTYLFYLEIAMYNSFFLAYVALTGTSFFALALVLLSIKTDSLQSYFKEGTPVKFIGGFLIFNSVCISFLWLSIVVPPLLDGTIFPEALEHYTTLTVQGLDLGLLLPIALVSGVLLIQKKNFGYLMATVTLVFLPLLMIALIAKIIAMALAGVNVIPVIFIIPTIALVSMLCGYLMLKNVKTNISS